MSDSTLYYIHDPMCSWCWGFRNTWVDVKKQLPANITVTTLLGGLAPDSNLLMPEDMQINIRDTWRAIQKQIPDTEFNFDFWNHCKPRRSTFPACRAVIAARAQGSESEMLLGIQQAYYTNAQNPSDDETLVSIARQLGLNIKVFSSELNSDETNAQLRREIEIGRSLGVFSFPSLLYKNANQNQAIAIDYNNKDVILNQILQVNN